MTRFPATTVALLLLASGLTAQTLPTPPPPPEPPPEAEPEPPGKAPPTGPTPHGEAAEIPSARPRPWEYALGAGAGWDSNIDFLIPDGPSGLALSPRGGFARVFGGPRGQLRATAAGHATGFPDHRDLDRYYADFSLDGNYRSSPGTQWRANASYGFGYSDASRILVDQGVLLPLVKIRSYAGALELSQRLGARTSLRIDGRYYRTDFRSADLIDGESARGSIGLEHQLGNRSTGAIEYAVEDVLSSPTGQSYVTHFASLRWTRLLFRQCALLFEGGASYTPDAARAALERKEAFFGGASFSRTTKRSNFIVYVRREVTPAFGIGVSRLELRGGLGASIPMGRAWELRTSASHVQPETPRAAPQVYPTSDDAFLALGRRLGRQLEISAEARYRRRGAASALPMIETFQAGLFLTLLSPSGRTIVPPPGSF
jgi:hypothetical protein